MNFPEFNSRYIFTTIWPFGFPRNKYDQFRTSKEVFENKGLTSFVLPIHHLAIHHFDTIPLCIHFLFIIVFFQPTVLSDLCWLYWFYAFDIECSLTKIRVDLIDHSRVKRLRDFMDDINGKIAECIGNFSWIHWKFYLTIEPICSE